MKKLLPLALIILLSACDRTKSESKPADGNATSGQTSTSSSGNGQSTATPATPDFKGRARAALQAKFDAWVAGTEKDVTFQSPDNASGNLLGYEIKAVVLKGTDERAFISTSSIELESTTGSPIKRQLRHSIWVGDNDKGTFVTAIVH